MIGGRTAAGRNRGRTGGRSAGDGGGRSGRGGMEMCIRDRFWVVGLLVGFLGRLRGAGIVVIKPVLLHEIGNRLTSQAGEAKGLANNRRPKRGGKVGHCLLYTSTAWQRRSRGR